MIKGPSKVSYRCRLELPSFLKIGTVDTWDWDIGIFACLGPLFQLLLLLWKCARLWSVGYVFLYTRVFTRVLWVLYSIIPYPNASVSSVRLQYPNPTVLKICTNFVPVSGYGACLCRNTRWRSVWFSYPTRKVLWVLYDFHTLTRQFYTSCNKSYTLQNITL